MERALTEPVNTEWSIAHWPTSVTPK
jgi:hypothetical protein